MGTVHLRVRDVAAMTSFYEDVLGFQVLAEDGATTALAAVPGRPLLVLHAAPGASPPEKDSAGLYHVAFLLPSRADLGAMIRRAREAGVSFDGFADHNVSEAVYLKDPEGNGLEFYADRDPAVWHAVDGSIFITTEPLDVDSLLLAGPRPAPRLPEGTRVGHVHLRVGELRAAEEFYASRLGFTVTSKSIPGALFVGAGGYHHHLGFNVWGGATRGRYDPVALGLVSFDIIVPDEDHRRRILDGTDQGLLFDPDGIGVRIVRG